MHLILDGGSARLDAGPSQEEASSQSSKNSKIKSIETAENQGKPNSPVLEDLHNSVQVQNGVLTVYVPRDVVVEQEPRNEIVEHNTSTEHVASIEPMHNDTHTQPHQFKKKTTWSSIVTKNVPNTETGSSETAQIVFNDDGSTTLKPPKQFLTNARKMWSTSLIGHFIGGSFDFKFIGSKISNYEKIWDLHVFYIVLKDTIHLNFLLFKKKMLF